MEISHIRKKLKTLAAVEAIVCPDWEERYFSYNSKWSEREEMASMRDGCGAEWFAWFHQSLIAYKYFSPEDGAMKDLEKVKKAFPSEYKSF